MSGITDKQGLFPQRSCAGTAYQRWFGRVVLIGVVVNIGLALPTMFAPNFVLELMRRPLTHEAMWANFAALLLILLSIFYVPGGIDPVRYRPSAWLAVLARLSGATFFLVTPLRHDWALFGWIDFAFFVPQSILLALSERAASWGERSG